MHWIFFFFDNKSLIRSLWIQLINEVYIYLLIVSSRICFHSLFMKMSKETDTSYYIEDITPMALKLKTRPVICQKEISWFWTNPCCLVLISLQTSRCLKIVWILLEIEVQWFDLKFLTSALSSTPLFPSSWYSSTSTLFQKIKILKYNSWQFWDGISHFFQLIMPNVQHVISLSIVGDLSYLILG